MPVSQAELDSANSTVQALLKKPLDIRAGPTERFTFPSHGRFRRERSPLSRYLERVHSLVPLNPSNADRRVAIRESYLPGSQDGPDAGALPSPGAMRELLEHVLDPDTRTIYLIGPRGSGKTAVLNYFLNEHQETLNQHNATWLRSDFSKIFVMGVHDPTRLTLEEYQRAHSIYVCIKYAPTDAQFAIFDRNQSLDPRACSFAQESIPAESQIFAEVWDEIVRCVDLYKTDSIAFVKHATAEYGRGENSRRAAYQSIYQRMMAAIGPQGKHRNVLVQILDGLDNIDRVTHEERYKEALAQMADEIGVTEKQSTFSKSVVVLRRETYQDLRKAINGRLKHSLPQSEQMLEIRPVDPERIFNHKQTVVEEPRSAFFREAMERARGNARFEQGWEKRLSNFAKAYFEELAQVCGRDKKKGDSSARVVLEVLFNDNLRSLCRNVVATYDYVRSHVRSRAVDPRNVEVMFQSILNRGRHLILEGSITAGEPMLMPAEEHNPEVAWCPNMFDFPLTENLKRWEGLCLLRLLQDLRARGRAGMTERQAWDLLSHLEYSEDAARLAISVAWNFGLWKVADSYGNSVPLLVLSRKGNYVMDAPFINPSVTYFMATATRFRMQHLEDSKMWELHNPRPGELRRFVPSATKTGLTLLRYIVEADAHERTAELLPGSPGRWALPMDLIGRFWLPAVKHNIETFGSFNESRAEQARELLRDLRSLQIG